MHNDVIGPETSGRILTEMDRISIAGESGPILDT